MEPSQANYQTKITKPQIFIIFAETPQVLTHQYELLLNTYKFTPLILQDLLNNLSNSSGDVSNNTTTKITDNKLIVRVLKKALALNGAKRYLIADFPQDKQAFQEFRTILGQEADIRKVILLKSAKAIQSSQNTINQEKIQKIEEKLAPLIEQLLKQNRLIQGSLEQSKQQLFQSLQNELSTHEVYPLPPVEVFFVTGGPGAGKGTQCANLVKDYGFKHLSTGDLLRDAIKNGSKQGLAIDQCIKNGQLVSSALLVDLIKCQIAKNNYLGKYLIDGFPRNVENDQVWTKMMEKDAILKGLIYMKCDEKTMNQRVIERSKTSGRSDDNAETMRKRFKVYFSETEPIIELYRGRNNVIEIDSLKSAKQVYAQLQSQLEKKNVFPKNKITQQQPGVILVLGGPGSGKGTQCENLVKHFGFKHLSTGDLLRFQKSQNGLNSQLIQDYIKEGKLVPSKILVRLIKKAMRQQGWNGIYLLDGFPRNLENIVAWQQQIGNQVHIQHCLLFDCSQQVMQQRLINRGKTSGRSDDNPETIKKRFATFQKQTSPIIALYETEHANIKVNAEKQIGQVFQNLKNSLIEKGFKPL